MREPNFTELQELNDIAPASIFSIAPCQPNACEVIAQAKKIGINSSAAHTDVTAAEVFAAKDAGLTRSRRHWQTRRGLLCLHRYSH